ncbi:MAG: DUF2273 domain-containing protein [Furfurilactobacillus sp.]|jgi:uncharacterized membrane protein|uniref:DUF2273 domain-containing protein n=1 Tax=Furfurilactobacillus milii TaxID=2888272 RepID=A0ABT6DD07_9LACO|nr:MULTISPECIES: DUF2273 domain-containing protein [Furfurilactobacillus]QLE65827.1 hypothetical protein LROSL2_0474 [Furfurilactobacillus rossiae]MCF6160264.1 DUF2273 domain-containing protein [Furfurilactobacillus milii]MCF6162207.1 DUF2273 domain-containing protein [Furfurilactobacillus milii]MCF6420450.1 DUF2273 domain-containing protein [Furfurilactobacillus milii]MCH4012348.1 DUF2273 domain-containing protein [Furfurilactobacillus sp.]
MSRPMFGTIVGLVLGLAWVLAGFWSMILVAVLALVGTLIGKYSRVVDRQMIKRRINQFLSS